MPKGFKHSEEAKEKIRLSKIGSRNPMYGKPSWNRGKTHSKKVKQKISKTKKGNSPAWNKGIPMAKETRKKCSIANKGQHSSPKTEFKKGHKTWNKGKKCPQYSGKNHWNWKGGKVYSQGYIWFYQPQHPKSNHGYVPEHRLVMEKHLGQYLKPKEEVHHIGKRNDNRLNMLMLFANHSAHQRFHRNPQSVKLSEIIFDGRKIIL